MMQTLLKRARIAPFGHSWKNTPGAALCDAMHGVATNDNASTRQELYTQLLQSTLWIAVKEAPKPTETRVELPMYRDREGRSYCPIFSDEEALRNWDPNTPYIGLKGPDLFKLIRGTDAELVYINPFDPIRKMLRPGGSLNRPEMSALAQGFIPAGASDGLFRMNHPKDNQLVLSLPNEPVHKDVASRIRIIVCTKAEVLKVFWVQYQTSRGGRGHTLGFYFKEGTLMHAAEAVLAEVARYFSSNKPEGFVLDMIILNKRLLDEAGKVGEIVYSSPH